MLQIENHFTKELGQLIPLDDRIDDRGLARIVEICNSPKVYKYLFEKKLAGRKYMQSDANQFVDWAIKGWHTEKWFVFLVHNSSSEIVGALDIKSIPPKAEIGYWADPNALGWMTNALKSLIGYASNGKYKSLYALVKIGNEKSARLLIRNNFRLESSVEREGEQYDQFVIDNL